MTNPLTYHSKIKNEQHVFIYCVAGRSSSTAFQRIVNSSNTVWLWGEQHDLIEDTVALINQMKAYQANIDVRNSLAEIYNSYKNNKHINFYPNAIGNLDTTIDILNSSISNILKPWAYGLKRFGFKDIGVRDITTISHLKGIFPQSLFVFCFRNPLTQWPSVKASGWWIYCKDLESFLDEYYRISNIYLEFASKTGIHTFIENTDLRDHNKVANIIAYLNIPKIDSTLLDGTIGSVKTNFLSDIDEEIILKSDAYNNYLTMKEISKLFYKVQ